MESSARLATSCLVVPILVATQEIHHGTFIVSHIVDHDAPKLHQENEVASPLEGPLPRTKYLGAIL